MTTKETAIALGLGLLLFWHYSCDQRSQGAIQEQIHATEQRVRARETVIAALVKLVGKRDTIYKKERATYTADSAAFDKAIGTLTPAEQLPFAKKVVASCSVVVLRCEEQQRDLKAIIAHQDTVIAQKDSIITGERKRRGKWWACVAGGAGTRKSVGPGVACGVRIL